MRVRRGTLLPGFDLPPPPTARGPNRHEEADLQRAIVRDLRRILLPDTILHASAHEVRGDGPDAAKAQAMLNAMGVHKGFSDLMVLAPSRALFMELKTKTGRLSTAQERFRDVARAQGHAWALVRSTPDALDALERAGIRTRLARAR